MPYFDVPSYACGEVATGRRKGESGDGRFEGEVVKCYTAGDVGKDRSSIFVDREQEVSARV